MDNGMPVIVRPITAGDFDVVQTLLAELGRPAPDPATDGVARAVFARHVASPGTSSLIAERDGRVAGFLSLHVHDRLNHATPAAWIPDLIVTEAAHGTGVATALMDRAKAIARERGCHALTLESGYRRLRAHRFYGREGFTDAGKYFTLRIDRAPDDEGGSPGQSHPEASS
ncbi:MAG: GNAT family N-acetyltransferase [Chloroflexota bacterium]|nr:GNAT family N-acetyltransferase [Chloroflexota bacterium]